MNNNHVVSYTDTPPPHSNLLIGVGQLWGWFFFHPSAWRHYVTRLNPALPPDFTLLHLQQTDWQKRPFIRLLIQSFIISPLLILLLCLPIMLWRGATWNEIVGTSAYILGINLTINLSLSLVLSVGGGFVGGNLISFAAGFIALIFLSNVATSIALGFTIGLTAAITARLTTQKNHPSSSRQLIGITLGVLIGVVALSMMRRGITHLSTLTAPLSENQAYYVARSLVVGLSYGVAIGLKQRWRTGFWVGLFISLSYLATIAGVRVEGLPWLVGLSSGMLFGISFGATVLLPYTLAEYIAGPAAGAWASALGSWGRHVIRNDIPIEGAVMLGLGGILLGMTTIRWRSLIFLPLWSAWAQILQRFDERRPPHQPSLLRWHPAFWDELNQHPLPGLAEHLLQLLTTRPAEGKAALRYLSTSPQRWAAQAVQIELEARQLADCDTIQSLALAHRQLAGGELVGPASALLRSFSHISQDIEVALSQTSTYNQRLVLSALDDRLNSFGRELTTSSEPYAVRFQPIVTQWQQAVMAYLSELSDTVERNQELDNPYIVGIPLTSQQDIFVGRADVVARIEQLLLDHRRPPLLLYGQRRMGKTSLLRNLGRLLPSPIIPLFVDGQRIALASSAADLLYNLSREMARSAMQQRQVTLPPLSLDTLSQRPFSGFNEWLDEVEALLISQGNWTALLALDEFEMLEHALIKGRFDEDDFFTLLRHIIQHRTRFKVMLAGSHTMQEFQRWASYLINVQVIKISYLSEAETRQLIESPINNFALRYEPQAVTTVINLTRGHPAMVQLLCYEIVTLKNEQPPSQRRTATVADVSDAVEQALESGSFFFGDIEQNQTDALGVSLLRFIATHPHDVIDRLHLTSQFATELPLEATLHDLCQRDILEQSEQGYRFQVELIRHWFKRR